MIDREWLLRQLKGGIEDWEVSDPDCGLDLEKYTVGRGVHQISRTAVETLQLMREAFEDACQAGEDLFYIIDLVQFQPVLLVHWPLGLQENRKYHMFAFFFLACHDLSQCQTIYDIFVRK